MNAFNRTLVQLAFICTFLFSRPIAQGLREYSEQFITFNPIFNQSCMLILAVVTILLLPAIVAKLISRFHINLSGYPLKFILIYISMILSYGLTTPLSSGIYVNLAPFFLLVGITLWHNKILKDTVLSVIISLLFNSLISILQNPLFPIHKSLFVQQTYYGRSAGLIGINQNGAFIAIFLLFIIISLSPNILNCDSSLFKDSLVIKVLYYLTLFFATISLLLTISRMSIITFAVALSFKYIRPPVNLMIPRKLILPFFTLSLSIVLTLAYLAFNFQYLLIRFFRAEDIGLDANNSRFLQLIKFFNGDIPSNLLGFFPSSSYINTVGDSLWVESLVAFGAFYTLLLFLLYFLSFTQMLQIASRSYQSGPSYLHRISYSLCSVCLCILFLSFMYGGLQSIPISSTFFFLVGVTYAESKNLRKSRAH